MKAIRERSLEQVADTTLRGRQLVIWLDESSANEADFAARLIGPMARTMIEEHATLAVVGSSGTDSRLRGVKRAAMVATCDLEFDRQSFVRLLDVT